MYVSGRAWVPLSGAVGALTTRPEPAPATTAPRSRTVKPPAVVLGDPSNTLLEEAEREKDPSASLTAG